MFLEIVTPEAVLFSSDVISVAVPSINGEFQILNNHAPVISLLVKGTIKIQQEGNSDNNLASPFYKTVDGRLGLDIKSGTVEMNNNKVIILAD